MKSAKQRIICALHSLCELMVVCFCNTVAQRKLISCGVHLSMMYAVPDWQSLVARGKDKEGSLPDSQLTLKKSNISTQGVNLLPQLISTIS